MTLCLQADVEDTLQVLFTNQPEDTITYLIEGADQAIKTWLGRAIEEATYTNELHDGEWGRVLLKLNHYPVTVLTEVRERSNLLVEGTDFQWYTDGRIARMSGERDRRWQVGRRIIDVTYTAGYATADIPADIRQVCAGIVARHFRAGAEYAAAPGSSGPVKSVSLDGSDSIEYAVSKNLAAVGQVAMLTDADIKTLGAYRKRLSL